MPHNKNNNRVIQKCMFIAVLFLLAFNTVSFAQNNEAAEINQYDVEFAILVRMMHFIEWPNEPSGDQSIKIAFVSQDTEIIEAAKKLSALHANSGIVSIEIIHEINNETDLSPIAVIYTDNESADYLVQTLKAEMYPILLIGSQEGFLEKGGDINFIKNQGRVAFEINVRNSLEKGINFRAKLLRLAQRIVK